MQLNVIKCCRDIIILIGKNHNGLSSYTILIVVRFVNSLILFKQHCSFKYFYVSLFQSLYSLLIYNNISDISTIQRDNAESDIGATEFFFL